VSYEEHNFREDKLPWYEAMLLLEDREFLKYFLLLRGIYQSNPKGFSWLNDFETISEITANCKLYTREDVLSKCPEWVVKSNNLSGQLNAIERGLKLISFTHLAGILARG
jgi:hypothetical protein